MQTQKSECKGAEGHNPPRTETLGGKHSWVIELIQSVPNLVLSNSSLSPSIKDKELTLFCAGHNNNNIKSKSPHQNLAERNTTDYRSEIFHLSACSSSRTVKLLLTTHHPHYCLVGHIFSWAGYIRGTLSWRYIVSGAYCLRGILSSGHILLGLIVLGHHVPPPINQHKIFLKDLCKHAHAPVKNACPRNKT